MEDLILHILWKGKEEATVWCVMLDILHAALRCIARSLSILLKTLCTLKNVYSNRNFHVRRTSSLSIPAHGVIIKNDNCTLYGAVGITW